MEPDRYKESQSYFIAGIAGLIGALVFLCFAIFLFPHLIFGWHYKIPDLIVWLKHMLHLDYGWSENLANWSIELFFLILGGIFALIAYIASNKLENRIYNPKEKSTQISTGEANKSRHEAILLFLKLFIIILVIYGIGVFFHWMIAKPGGDVIEQLSAVFY